MNALYPTLIAIAVILVYLVVRAKRGSVPKRAQLELPPADTASQDSEPGKDNDPARPQSGPGAIELAARLRELGGEFDQLAQDASHPSEIEGHAAFKTARDLLADMATPLASVIDMATAESYVLNYPALTALVLRADREGARDRILAHFNQYGAWGMHFALAYFRSLDAPPAAGAQLVHVTEWWASSAHYARVFREHFEALQSRGVKADFGDPAPHLPRERANDLRNFLRSISLPFASDLLAAAEQLYRTQADDTFLSGFGRFWRTDLPAHESVEPQDWSLAITQAQALMQRQPPRSFIASGEPQTGKTSFLRLLAMRLHPQGWRIFEAGAPEIMAGQKWFGELEERIRKLVEEATVERKLVWYAPDLLSLAQSGAHQNQSASILDQVMPALTAGRMVLWSETTPDALARLLQAYPALRNAMEMVRLEPMAPEAAGELADAVAARMQEAGLAQFDPSAIATALDVAPHYLGSGHLPGSALTLLKLAAMRRSTNGSAKPDTAPVSAHDVLAALAALTGLPESILDASGRLDVAAIRNFLSSRVMGQEEAVNAIVDRIVMLKAGLNDPGKPVGVFLFAGPTGTGKTELAKAAAEYLFGSADRMIRLDMSEFQTPDAMAKLTGAGDAQGGSLIARVRKQPFCVILLDEFEKSYSGVWDLFLQVFDDGRLSDSAGHAADFRHAIIILTSNLGATDHRTGGFGFAPPPDQFVASQVMDAIGKTYRPEFQNRIDKIIVFRPLDRDLMRLILRKELDQVLLRRGLKDRTWAVEWEPSAIEFLLEKGFTPEMGARPLKRAIDQHLLAPLAAALVSQHVPDGEQFVFVRSDGQRIHAHFVDANSSPAPAAAAPDDRPASTPADVSQADLAAIICEPQGERSELETLASALADVSASFASQTVEELKSQLTGQMTEPGFWSAPDRYRTLARYGLIDRVKAATDSAKALLARLRNMSDPRRRLPREVVARLALQVHLLRHGIEDILADPPVEIALAIEPALDGASADAADVRAWRDEISAMYAGWCARRNMQWEELPQPGNIRKAAAGFNTADAPARIFAISGFGAHRVLSRETGLHVLEKPQREGARLAARVTLCALPQEDAPAAIRRRTAERRLAGQDKPANIVRRYRREPAPMITDATGQARSANLDDVLAGNFDLIAGRDNA